MFFLVLDNNKMAGKVLGGSKLTRLFTVGDHELQHLVHRSHEEDDPQLGHPHRHQTPQEDGREHRPAEGRRL